MSGPEHPVSGEGPSESPSPNALPVGTRISDFEITGIVGEGGFGIVYEAFDHTLHRKVALKEYMPNTLARRRDGASIVLRSQRFETTFVAGLKSYVNEARLLAQFDHPALVKVFRFWEENDTAYMVMPLYEGRTLKEFLREHPAPDEGFLKALTAPLLDALEILHGARFYHRDIAPDNILVLDNGAPVLLDFGAARRIIGEGAQDVTVILKPGYAPIEQYADDETIRQGPWTDIYAMSAVLRFAVTGKAPPASVTRVVTDPVHPLAESVTGYSRDFLTAIDRGFAVRPQDRPQSIAEFRQMLGIRTMAPSQQRSVAARPPSDKPSGAGSQDASAAVPRAPATARPAMPPVPAADVPQSGAPASVPFMLDSISASKQSVTPPSHADPAIAPGALPERPASGAAAPTPLALGSAAGPKPGVAPSPQARPLVTPGSIAGAAPGGAPAPAPFRLDSVTGPKPMFPQPAPPAASGAGAGTSSPAPASTAPGGMSRAGWLGVAGGIAVAAAVVVGLYQWMRPSGDAPGAGAKAVARAPAVESGAVRAPAAPGAEPSSNAAPPATAVAVPESARAETAPSSVRATAPKTPVVPPEVAGRGATPPSAAAAPAAATLPAAASRQAAAEPPAAAPPTGRIALDIKPWGEVFVDGRSRGLSPPIKNLQLPEGRFRIEVRNPASATVAREVEIKAGRSVTIAHTFK
jgi:non-specific serine/threonine protein kinase